MDEKILELLNEMNNNIVDMKQDITGMKQDIVDMKQDIKGMKQDIADLKTGQIETNNRLDIVESQAKENTQILKALEHKADVSKAEHDKMSFDISRVQGDMTETKENIQEISNKLNTLETVTIDNWKDITKLKAIK
ncbi:hypothetical protein M1I50_09610 [Clostridioides difficile]|nr:hypothetical protein [Clostridioides difficile]MCL0943239.1 hypothetical protein [Clostridioides difficile]MDI2845760.1 hypothetical protein [Clostridioides difficile]